MCKRFIGESSISPSNNLSDSAATSSSLSSSSKPAMKIIKSFKKLKFWSRKKRKKKSAFDPYYTNFYHQPSPPSTYHYHHCYSYNRSSAQPSAPPLPPWLEYEQTRNAAFSSESTHHGKDLCVPEIVVETTSVDVSNDSSNLYQQYMVPNPVVQRTRRKRFSEVFGCVIKFGANLIRCFCPCFRFREVYQEI